VASESAYYKKVSQGLPDVIGILGIVETLIFSIGAVLGAMITMHASVSQRSREIGVLRALGFGRLKISFLRGGVGSARPRRRAAGAAFRCSPRS